MVTEMEEGPAELESAIRALIEARSEASSLPRPLARLAAAIELPVALEQVTIQLAQDANAEFTWAQIGDTVGKSSQMAHHLWAPGRGGRLSSLKSRVGSRRPSMATPETPGLSAAEAAKRLGCDPRTLPGKARSGEIQEIEVTLATGRIRRRYILPDGL